MQEEEGDMSELYDADIPKEYHAMVSGIVTKFSKETSLAKHPLLLNESWGWVLAWMGEGMTREIVVAARIPFFEQQILPRVERLLVVFPRIFVKKNSQVFCLPLTATLIHRKIYPLIVPILPSSRIQGFINEGIRDMWQVVQSLSVDHATEPHFL
ncbi:MAG: hypothetical protein G01um101433_401 [Parcubacteria group bacterium Gr01-1014_33]|nr:MAG: hypothetical protein G01um101433_401 [Parcubacteria group bacterium Gr01-1014_33]